MRCNMKKCGCVRPPDYGRTRSESSDEAQDLLRFRTSSSAENVSWVKSQGWLEEEGGTRGRTKKVILLRLGV